MPRHSPCGLVMAIAIPAFMDANGGLLDADDLLGSRFPIVEAFGIKSVHDFRYKIARKVGEFAIRDTLLDVGPATGIANICIHFGENMLQCLVVGGGSCCDPTAHKVEFLTAALNS